MYAVLFFEILVPFKKSKLYGANTAVYLMILVHNYDCLKYTFATMMLNGIVALGPVPTLTVESMERKYEEEE